MTSQNRLFCRQSARFLTIYRHNGEIQIYVSCWISTIYTTSTKTSKNRRKIAGRKTRRFLRRFFNVKIVSYTPYSGLRLTLSWHECGKRQAAGLWCFHTSPDIILRTRSRKTSENFVKQGKYCNFAKQYVSLRTLPSIAHIFPQTN